MFKKLSAFVLALGLLFALSLNSFAAAITPSTIRQEVLGSVRLIIANFADTSDDADTWASGLSKTPPIAYWTSHTENPTTQASVGVAVNYSAGTFTFYPAEDNAAFTLFVLIRS